MVDMVERIPRLLKSIFGVIANQTARDVGFIQRERCFSGSDFVCTLAFGWLAAPDAAIEALADDLGISGPALQQRLTESGAKFLWTILEKAVAALVSSRVARIPILSKFEGVYAEDCSSIILPPELAELFPGCGCHDEHSAKSALKLFACYELKTGTLQQLATAKAPGTDVAVARLYAPELPRGSLRLRDMGFFDRQLLAEDTANGLYWISRLPACLTVQPEGGKSMQVSEYLLSQPSSVRTIDTWLCVGKQDKSNEPLRCRFLAVRCPSDVAAERRRKVQEAARRRGKQASQRQLILCDWTVMITNVPEDMISLEEAWELYCTRWQIELLFKRWKSLGKVQIATGLKPNRALIELYAKLLGMLVAHWFTLTRGGPLEGFSLSKAIKKVQGLAKGIAEALALDCPELLEALVAKIAKLIARIPKQKRRKKRPSTRQRLFKSRLKT
jgi:hypothetical protein